MTGAVFVGSCEGRRDMGMDDLSQGALMGKWEVKRGVREQESQTSVSCGASTGTIPGGPEKDPDATGLL